LQFLIQALCDLALFQLAKGDCRQGHIGYSGLNAGKKMAFYLQKLVIVVCFIQF
jgi:hypothetical protein